MQDKLNVHRYIDGVLRPLFIPFLNNRIMVLLPSMTMQTPYRLDNMEVSGTK